jgi:hypothetical protein
MDNRYVFQHSFGSGCTCTIAFQPGVHYDRATNTIRLAKQWSPQPSEEDFHAFYPQYVEWMHAVNAHLSEITGSDHTYVFQDSYADEPFWEFWVYHANGEKECVAKQRGFFDPSLIGR